MMLEDELDELNSVQKDLLGTLTRASMKASIGSFVIFLFTRVMHYTFAILSSSNMA